MDLQETAGMSATNIWDQFLQSERPDVGYKQSSWWSDFSATRGWGSFGIAVRDGDTIAGGARVLIKSFAAGKCYYYIPHGPILPQDDADAEQIFRELMSDINASRKEEPQIVSHLRIEPRWLSRPSFTLDWHPSSGWFDPRRTLCVDLSLSESEILAQMKAKGRYNISLARRKGVVIVEDTSREGISDFVDIYKQTFRRHGLHGHSRRYFGDLMERLLTKECGTILFAEYQGQRLATALIIYFGDTATYKYGGSLSDHRNLMAPYLLHFAAMLRAKSRGHHWYDFYGIAPQDNSQDEWANFSAFKRKFGGCEQSYVPALDLIYDTDAYDEYRNQT